ncbi:MAG: hypothetical protein ACHBN1_02105 [Heteroscytonema crispum UTEX LB 1556]
MKKRKRILAQKGGNKPTIPFDESLEKSSFFLLPSAFLLLPNCTSTIIYLWKKSKDINPDTPYEVCTVIISSPEQHSRGLNFIKRLQQAAFGASTYFTLHPWDDQLTAFEIFSWCIDYQKSNSSSTQLPDSSNVADWD